MRKKFAIIGGGSWGTALAQFLARNGNQVLIFVRDKKLATEITEENINHRYFPGYRLNTEIKATSSVEAAVNFSRYILLTVPTQVTREVMEIISPFLDDGQVIISTAKGIELDTFLRNSQIIKQYFPGEVVVLSGPTHAEEVIKGLPSAAVLASPEKKLAGKIQQLFMSPDFRFYVNQDVVGVELAGSIKNVIALASGIADGLGYGDNSRAALITRGLREISRFGKCLGGNPMTFSGLAGMGDLVVTCTSMHSRNRRFGIKIGEGKSFRKALEEIGQVVEGVKTAKAIYSLLHRKEFDVELPITTQTYQVLFENKKPEQAVQDLMEREAKRELV